ncbi:MAG: A/G-specific adenine glycosylase [Burkholderiales bacterium]
MNDADFAARVSNWQKRHGRHHLPWQNTRDPYRVWLSEIMLQQTQVATVIPYYSRFLDKFPSLRDLARASEDEVLAVWSGLGYYSRGRNLLRAAQNVVEKFSGEFPRAFDHILALPGIGPSTAAAISAFAFGERRAILDGNVKRIFARHFGIAGLPGEGKVEAKLWNAAEAALPKNDIEPYTQGLMDLGATVCLRARPLCRACPVKDSCVANREGRIHELPSPRPKKSVPEKSTTMLIIAHEGEVLLEKRPSIGVWAGMWCFPELQNGASPGDACRERYGLEITPLKPWSVLEHGFSHYKLSITPQPIEVRKKLSRAAEPGVVWRSVDYALKCAIPKPVRVLLTKLDENKDA